MKYLILVFAIFISAHSFSYTKKQIDLSDYEYKRFVRSGLKNIVYDFESLLFLLLPEKKFYHPYYQDVFSILKLQSDLKLKCVESFIDKNCATSLQSVELILKKLLDKFEKSESPSEEKSLTRQVKELSYFASFQNKVLKTLMSTQTYLFQYNDLEHKVFSLKIYSTELDQIFNIFNLHLMNSLPEAYQNEVIIFWNDFIVPVQNFIIIADEKEYFITEITRLNMTWNLLNVKLTKRNIKFSKQILTLLKIMHNRWNRILKVGLNTKN